jgi:hypothetical protein
VGAVRRVVHCYGNACQGAGRSLLGHVKGGAAWYPATAAGGVTGNPGAAVVCIPYA